jgi:4-amino-4-deoxychorismate lyase
LSTWINGRRRSSLDQRDRGFQYGDGLFETMRIRGGAIRLLPYHLERLSQGCRRLKMPLPDTAALQHELETRSIGHAEGVLKLIVTRGVGPRGYQTSRESRPTRVISVHPLTRKRRESDSKSVRVCLCSTPFGLNPALAGLKTLNRLENVMARSEWRDDRYWEGLMSDTEGNIVSGTMANLFLRRGAFLLTPLLDRCGIAGIMRRFVMEHAAAADLRVLEGRVSLDVLGEAEEVFMTNAVAGIVSVASLSMGGRRIEFNERPGPNTGAAGKLRALLDRS